MYVHLNAIHAYVTINSICVVYTETISYMYVASLVVAFSVAQSTVLAFMCVCVYLLFIIFFIFYFFSSRASRCLLGLSPQSRTECIDIV